MDTLVLHVADSLADQFAFWATGRREVRSSYDVPLLHRAQFGRFMDRVLRAPPAPAAG